MTRMRLYNPAQLTPEELKASFVAREDTLADMLRLIRDQAPGQPCQHMMLIGPRGMGKTTLGLRFLHEVADIPNLAAAWQPVPFHEESYGIGDLADFWLAALHHLTRATEEPRWADRAEALERDEKDLERVAAYALATLLDFREASSKRLVLFVENLDAVFSQMGNRREIHGLRASLIQHPDILLIGSANTVFEAIRGHREPLYEFFRLFTLKGLERDETLRLLEKLAECEGRPGLSDTLSREHGRLETIRRLTGGNPRLLVLACRMLIESPLGSAFEDLERLIDEQTPYFKARIEELPVQARKVFHCLAEGWKPMLSREVADAAKLGSSHASAQLKQLKEKGYARELRLPNEKRTRYEVGDRFYNIYYLLRFSRKGRDRLARLVAFLHDLFGPAGMRTMYPATLAALRAQASGVGETSDWLSILAKYVAGDEGFEDRDDWLRQALDLAKDVGGPDAPVIEEIQRALTDQHPSSSARLIELKNHGSTLLQARRFMDMETMCRKAITEGLNDASLWMMLGIALLGQERPKDAIEAFDHTLNYSESNDNFVWPSVPLKSLAGKSLALFRLGWYEASAGTMERVLENVDPDKLATVRPSAGPLYILYGDSLAKTEQYEKAMVAWEQAVSCVRVDDPEDLRHLASHSLTSMGDALSRLERHEEAITAWERVAEYVHVDDPSYLRYMAAKSLAAKTNVLARLGRHEAAVAASELVVDYVHIHDPMELRHTATATLLGKATSLLDLKRHENLYSVWLAASEYVLPEDPPGFRQVVVKTLTAGGRLLNLFGEWCEAEAVARRATKIEPLHDDSWCVLAEAILCQDDPTRLAEAEECARRAVQMAPNSPVALHTLADVVAERGDWTEAVSMLERALRIGSGDFQNRERPGLTKSLIQIAAAGHGPWVKRMMEETGLTEPMEPLWHAVRAELGEVLEPLPAEIMDTVNDIREEFAVHSRKPDGQLRSFPNGWRSEQT